MHQNYPNIQQDSCSARGRGAWQIKVNNKTDAKSLCELQLTAQMRRTLAVLEMSSLVRITNVFFGNAHKVTSILRVLWEITFYYL